MKILNVMEPAFKAYGKVVKGLDVSDLLAVLEKIRLHEPYRYLQDFLYYGFQA